MIFQSGTVLVLGAGASLPYRFPLGQELKKTIIVNTASASSTSGKQFLEAGFSEDQVLEFNKDLVRSIFPTIDAFLENRPSRREIGAFAIAQALMPIEDENVLFPPKDWYPALFHELDFKDHAHTPSVIGVVTFNYDRSLEHYMRETINRSFEGAAKDKALEKLESVPIIHVHGQVGPYPDVPYLGNRSVQDIKKGAEGISLIHDTSLDSAESFEEARFRIKEATEVVFLGFGYDRRSLMRLGALGSTGSRRFWGTAYNVPSEEVERIRGLCRPAIHLSASTVEVFLRNFQKEKKQLLHSSRRAVSASRR